jgi:hypothetical protein
MVLLRLILHWRNVIASSKPITTGHHGLVV